MAVNPSGSPPSLVAPFERDPDKRLKAGWIDRDHPDAPPQRIRADGSVEIRADSTAVLSYGDYFGQYRSHPDAKALDRSDERGCHPWTTAVLVPHNVRGTELRRVGKECNRLADTPRPVDDDDEALIEHPSARRCRRCGAHVSRR